jgi:hypothetical protein
MKKNLLFFMLLATVVSLHARSQVKQYSQIKGQLIDKANQQPLFGGSVTLLHARDSSRAAVASTDRKGIFTFDEVRAGDYMLYISFLGYESLSRIIQVADNKSLDLGGIFMQKKGITLVEVEILGTRSAMTIKKDTLEFSTSYFKTPEHAMLEVLLKRLPGVQVERDGTIKVHGETVKRILVDGKPFFGDDPKLAARNLTADMIDKVQLINQRPDPTQLSGAGINNNKIEKAINITVKKENKRNLSGHATAGYGTDKRFAVNSNLNQFKDERHLTLLANGNNVNDYVDGGVQNNIAGNDNGIIRNWKVGMNYSENSLGNVKITGSYIFTNSHIESQQNNIRQNLLPDTTYYYNQNIHSQNNNANHNLLLRMDYSIDTMHQLSIVSNFNYTTNNNDQLNQYETLGNEQKLLNSGTMHNTGSGSTPKLSAVATFDKKFNKAERTLTTQLSIGYSDKSQERINRSRNSFVQPDGTTYTDVLNQRDDISGRLRQIVLFFAYTEPLFKEHSLRFAYSYDRSHNTSDKFTYDYNASRNIYDRLNDSLSNAFRNISSLQTSSISIQAQTPKYSYSIGMNLLFSKLENNDISRKDHNQLSTVHVFPLASFNYTLTNDKLFRFTYSGSVEQPGIKQLQPVRDNSNPLYIQLGNLELRPTSTHTFNLEYNAFNAATDRTFTVNMNASSVNNKVVYASWFDSLGRQVSQPVNVNGPFNINANITNAFSLKKLQTFVNAYTAVAFGRDVTYMNGIKSNTRNFNVSQRINFSYSHEELFNLTTEAGVDYNAISYSIQKDNSTSFFSGAFSFDGNLNLPLGFVIGGKLDYLLNGGRAAGYNRNITMLSAFVSKNVFKNKQGLIKLQGFDLLKQNVNIVRNIGETYIEDVQTNALQRFFMISFSYFLQKEGGMKEEEIK